MNLNIDYKRTPDQLLKMGNVALTQDYLQYAIGQKYPQMEGQKLRIYGRIQRKLDKVKEAEDECKIFGDKVLQNGEKEVIGYKDMPVEASTVSFESAEIDMIKESFKDLKAAAGLAKYITILMDAVDELGKEPKAAA